MSERVTMPALGESVTEGTVTRWLKQVGDTIAVDEPLVEVSTDKVDTEIPSPVAGTIVRILVAEDETAEVGSALVEIGTADEAAQSASQPAASSETQQPSPSAEQATAEAPAAPEAPAQQPSTELAEPVQQAPTEGGSGEEITMPALGESVTEGTVTRWLKKEGDSVAVDEPLLEVSTDKVDTEIPSPVAGVLTKILVHEDDTAEVGAPLAIIGGGAPPASAQAADKPAAEAAAPAAPAPAAAPAPQQPVASAPQAPAAPPAPAPPAPAPQAPSHQGAPAPHEASAPADRGNTVYATPMVRKLASDLGVDLASVKGSGNAGRIRKQDVLDAAKPAAASAPSSAAASSSAPAAAAPTSSAVVPSPKRGTVEPMSRMRKVIAQRMVESLQVSAQLTTVLEVDVTRIAQLRAKHKTDFQAREGVKLTYMPFFMLAAVEALKTYPMVNASVEGDSIVYHAEENLSVAVDTDRGLMVPVIRDAGNLNLAGLAKKTSDLAERTRTQKITPDEMAGGTFTITNTGSRGALFDTPIINQPQVAILGTGAVVKRPVVMTDADGGETIAIRSMVYLALSYDHRIVDGADAARFLSAMKVRLEEGAFEV